MKIIDQNKFNNLSLSELECLHRLFRGKKKEFINSNNLKGNYEISEVLSLITDRLKYKIDNIFEFENCD